MSGLLFLSSEDFHISEGSKGAIMCTAIPGFCLILFYSTQCKYCQDLIPIYKTLPGNIGGCQFGMINVSQNKKCILMSKNTIAPITVVPYLILYINGKPYMRYQGPHEASEISRFVMEISKKIQQKPNFKTTIENKPNTIKKNKKSKIPEFTIGYPICGDEKCYLEFEGAYGNLNNINPNNSNRRVNGILPAASGM
tara:strand:- start:14047 stop:14634 length:588 start_codon:yes stop_codon:yes gene_type:complete